MVPLLLINLNEIYTRTLDYLEKAPPLIQIITYFLLLLILFFFVILLWKITHNFIRERWRDLICGAKNLLYVYVIKKESSRLTNILNRLIRKEFKRGEYSYEKIRVEPIDADKESASATVSKLKRSAVLVLREPIKKNDRSDNLTRIVSSSVIYGLLGHTRKYISPELSMAINNVEIKRQLRKIGDYRAEKLFIDNMKIKNPLIESHMEKLDNLRIEGVYKNVFVPYLSLMGGFSPPSTINTKQDSDGLLDWISDFDNRLENPFSSECFPKTKFVYVRKRGKPIRMHIHRVTEGFETLDCDIVIVMGWGEHRKNVPQISKYLKKLGYPLCKNFKGHSLKLDKKTVSAVHKKDKDRPHF